MINSTRKWSHAPWAPPLAWELSSLWRAGLVCKRERAPSVCREVGQRDPSTFGNSPQAVTHKFSQERFPGPASCVWACVLPRFPTWQTKTVLQSFSFSRTKCVLTEIVTYSRRMLDKASPPVHIPLGKAGPGARWRRLCFPCSRGCLCPAVPQVLSLEV